MVTVCIVLSSALAIYIHYKGEFDPVREIQKLQRSNMRDDAHDMATFFMENKNGNPDKIRELEKDLRYTTTEKIKLFTWNGAIKGEVLDTYSGIGAISADLCIVGDIRDVSVQSWKYVMDRENFDKMVMLLSAAGIGLSSTPFLKGTRSLAKNTLKFLKRVPPSMNKGLLKKFLSGKFSKQSLNVTWGLFKKTTIAFPAR